jgi:dGTP triphosphohydrolase
MIVNKFITRIQSRLSRKGIKVSMGEIRPIYYQLCPNPEQPTEQELMNVATHFMNTSLQLVPITEEVEATSPSIGEENANLTAPTPMALETSDPSEQDTEIGGALQLQQKHELVSTTAQSLGIVLDTAEITNIADNINYSSHELHDSIDEIKSAIIAFIEHKAAVNSQKIQQLIGDITQVAADKFDENSQQLTEGLQEINHQLQQQTKDFKSQVKATLAAFKVPVIKAG